MTNEQRGAIEICKEKIIESFYDFPNPTSIELKDTDVEAIEIVLSLIKEQQEKIAKYEKIYKEYDCYRWVKELDKRDKQIDLMAEKINEGYCNENFFWNWFEKNFGKREADYTKEIKQYFERKVEE